jgi:hypothetical protein
LNLFQDIPDHFFSVIAKELAPPKPVFTPPELSHFGGWVVASGMRPEGGRQFSLANYPYQRELYNEQRTAFRQRVVIMKAAQTGLTVKLMNRGLWLASDALTQINVGLYFPNEKAVLKLSAGRLRPQMNSSARVQMLLRANVNNVALMRVGRSNFGLFGVLSGVSQDSTPIDAELVDEVRLMATQTLERLMVRVSESTIRDPVTGTRGIIEFNSTAGFPEQDIHKFFLESTQGWWSVPCPDTACSRHTGGIVLPREFAESVGRVVGQEKSGWYYLKCPKCGARIHDDAQQRGWYEHENPGAQWTGYQFSQLGKGEGFLNSEIMPAWDRKLNIPEFFNSRLGLPYMDADAVPASKSVIEQNMQDTHHWWPEPLGRDAEWRSLGIDQRAGEKHCVVKTLTQNGLHRLDHLHVIEANGEDAVREAVQLAHAWGVKIVICDGEPSYDFFISLARALPVGMVWQQDYVDGQAQTVQWEDKRRDKKIKKSSGELKYEQRVLIDRFKGLDWSLNLMKYGRNLLPARSEFYDLVVPRIINGVRTGYSMAEEYVTHLGNLAKVKLQKTVTLPTGEKVALIGEYTQIWRNINLDPHFAHANLYADVGLARKHQEEPLSMQLDTPTPVPADRNGIPTHLRPENVAKMDTPRLNNTCGGCKRFQQGYCRHPENAGRNVSVGETDPGCDAFSARVSLPFA